MSIDRKSALWSAVAGDSHSGTSQSQPTADATQRPIKLAGVQTGHVDEFVWCPHIALEQRHNSLSKCPPLQAHGSATTSHFLYKARTYTCITSICAHVLSLRAHSIWAINWLKVSSSLKPFNRCFCQISFISARRQHIAYMRSALWMLSIARLSVSVRHTGRWVKTVKVRIMKFSPYGGPIPLVFVAKFHPEILTGAPEQGRQTREGAKTIQIGSRILTDTNDLGWPWVAISSNSHGISRGFADLGANNG